MPQGHKDWANIRNGRFSNWGVTEDAESEQKTIYLVPTDTTLYITSYSLSGLNNAASARMAILYIDSPGAYPNVPLMNFYVGVGLMHTATVAINSEIIVAAGGKIMLWSDIAGFLLTANIIGYLI